MRIFIRGSASGIRCGAPVAVLVLLLALAGCGGDDGGPGGGDPDPARDGCAPYDHYTDGAVPAREAAGWIGGLIEGVAVDADRGLAVLASRSCGLRVVDVADPAAPRLLGVGDSRQAAAVSLQGTLAAVAEDDRGFSLHDLGDPAAPRLLARVKVTGPGQASTHTDAVALAGDRLFVAGFHNQLVCYDVADPARPRELDRLTIDRPGALAVRGNRLFAGGRCVLAVAPDGRLAMVQDLGRGAAEDLLLLGDRLHGAVGDGLVTWDVADPDTVVEMDLQRVDGARALAGAGDLVWLGSMAQSARLKVLDFGAPGAPVQLASVRLADFAVLADLAVAGGHLLAADRWLRTIDLGDPAAPAPLPPPAEPAYPQGLAVVGDRAVVVDGPLVAVYALAPDLGRADAPVAVHDVGSSVLHVAAGAGRAYLVRNAPGLAVLDPARDDGAPVVRDAGTWFGPLAVSDSLLATGSGGVLRLYALRDPDRPLLAGSLDFGDQVRAVAVAGDRVLVSLAGANLVLVDVSDPAAPVEIARDPQPDAPVAAAAIAWADSVGLEYAVDGRLRLVRPDGAGRLATTAAVWTAGEGRDLAVRGPVAYALSGLAWGGESYLLPVDRGDPARLPALGVAVRRDAVLRSLQLAGDHLYVLTNGGLLRYWLDCRSLD